MWVSESCKAASSSSCTSFSPSFSTSSVQPCVSERTEEQMKRVGGKGVALPERLGETLAS